MFYSPNLAPGLNNNKWNLERREHEGITRLKTKTEANKHPGNG